MYSNCASFFKGAKILLELYCGHGTIISTYHVSIMQFTRKSILPPLVASLATHSVYNDCSMKPHISGISKSLDVQCALRGQNWAKTSHIKSVSAQTKISHCTKKVEIWKRLAKYNCIDPLLSIIIEDCWVLYFVLKTNFKRNLWLFSTFGKSYTI